MSTETFIRTYLLNETDACKKIINFINTSDDARPGQISHYEGSVVCKEKKESFDLSLTVDNAYEHKEFEFVLDFLWESVLKYCEEFIELQGMEFRVFPIFNIQKYVPPTGGYHAYHCERSSLVNSKRLLTWMVYLNTLENGGETEWKYQNIKEKPIEGKVVIWPTDFTHTHRGVKANKVKYILTGWYELT